MISSLLTCKPVNTVIEYLIDHLPEPKSMGKCPSGDELFTTGATTVFN
jgi:hypothetical protein